MIERIINDFLEKDIKNGNTLLIKTTDEKKAFKWKKQLDGWSCGVFEDYNLLTTMKSIYTEYSDYKITNDYRKTYEINVFFRKLNNMRG